MRDIRPSALLPYRRACMVRHGDAEADWRKRGSRRISARRKLWFAAGRSVPDGDARAVRVHDRSYSDPGSHRTSGLRIGRQRHMARLCLGDRRRAACRALREQVRALLGLAWIALLLRFDGSSASVRGHRRLEPAARLCGNRIERHWRLLSLRQSLVARCHRPRRLGRFSVNFGHGNFDLDRLA